MQCWLHTVQSFATATSQAQSKRFQLFELRPARGALSLLRAAVRKLN